MNPVHIGASVCKTGWHLYSGRTKVASSRQLYKHLYAQGRASVTLCMQLQAALHVELEVVSTGLTNMASDRFMRVQQCLQQAVVLVASITVRQENALSIFDMQEWLHRKQCWLNQLFDTRTAHREAFRGTQEFLQGQGALLLRLAKREERVLTRQLRHAALELLPTLLTGAAALLKDVSARSPPSAMYRQNYRLVESTVVCAWL